MGANLQDELPSQDEVIELFLLWKKEHGRVYKDLEEMAKKFEIFVSNLKYITEFNEKRRSPSSCLFGLNKFADWSPKEFQETYLGDFDITPKEHSNVKQNNLYHADVPESLDWRKYGVVTGVKDQGPCGSCWAFSAAGGIEGIHALTTGSLISLSEQELLDCETASSGCSGGYKDKALAWVIRNGGISSEIDYPYQAKQGACKSSEVPNVASIDGYVNVDRSDNGLLDATKHQPISVSVNATGFQFYKSGIFDGPGCANSTSTNHAVIVVGYDSLNGEDYWIVKNSWGKDWGIDGYIWIKRNTGLPYGVCAINAKALYPTITSKHVQRQRWRGGGDNGGGGNGVDGGCIVVVAVAVAVMVKVVVVVVAWW
ncbi:ervatamin-B-like [Gastrolobium bilobum]|uniref:ervatamin-B-like n=1 Tax=Gastrolobium bilobum TaxID=150636 RepID=UPI002AB27470|nr:ervatamin-B-like [Gastrolobium bilobum]